MVKYYVLVSRNMKLLITKFYPACSKLPMPWIRMFLSAPCNRTFSPFLVVLDTLCENLYFLIIYVSVTY